MKDTLDQVNAYLSDELDTIGGWCIPHLWQSIWPLAEKVGPGPICEIGVFEGKFFVGLAKTFGAEGPHAAIDVFDMQEFNLDKAGVGKLDVFRANLSKHGVNAEAVECLQRDSLTLNIEDVSALRKTYGGFKFFSVDGGHEVLHTTSDVEFAMAVTHPKGIISVDDYTNPNWPGVMEAIAKMYLLREFAFVPLLFTCNKLFLCSRSYLDEYRDHVATYIRTYFPETRVREVMRFGYKTLSVMPNFQNKVDLQ